MSHHKKMKTQTMKNAIVFMNQNPIKVHQNIKNSKKPRKNQLNQNNNHHVVRNGRKKLVHVLTTIISQLETGGNKQKPGAKNTMSTSR